MQACSVPSYAFLHVRFLIFIDCCGFISVVSFPPSGLKIQTSLMSFATRDKNSGQSTKMSVSCCVDSVAFCDSKLFLKGFMHNELLILGIIYQWSNFFTLISNWSKFWWIGQMDLTKLSSDLEFHINTTNF